MPLQAVIPQLLGSTVTFVGQIGGHFGRVRLAGKNDGQRVGQLHIRQQVGPLLELLTELVNEAFKLPADLIEPIVNRLIGRQLGELVKPMVGDVVISQPQGVPLAEQAKQIDRHQFLIGKGWRSVVAHALEM
jgi:hypothetical protein